MSSRKTKEVSDKFCRKCGKQVIVMQISAGDIERVAMFGGSYHPYSHFDEDTGKPNIGLRYKCPDSRWYNSHDEWEELLTKKE